MKSHAEVIIRGGHGEGEARYIKRTERWLIPLLGIFVIMIPGGMGYALPSGMFLREQSKAPGAPDPGRK